MEALGSCCKLNDAAIGLAEMLYLKRQEEQQQGLENDAAKGTSLARQVLLPASSPICSSRISTLGHIKVYSYYQIDHAKLPVKAPDQIKLIRVVMVSEKSRTRVEVRFPSENSLRAHLSEGNCRKELDVKRMPSLDEKYTMEPGVAGEVLYRRVQADEIGENRNSWSFWVVPSCDVEVAEKKGLCWSELRSSGMVKWGRRKKVQYLGRYEEEKSEGRISSHDCVRGESDEEQDEIGSFAEEEEDLKAVMSLEVEKNDRKRKRHVSTGCNKPSKCEKKKKKKKKVVKNSSDRWSKERYTLAEVNMLKILKEKGAVYGKPILRSALRTEARKLIGDTGLLDHLLKHMAGKVAPGGQERFRRRHNADGAMEYWLESSDLINIRKQAGVQDPYWTPPPGWKPGDNPTQDPVCAREFKQLKKDMAKMKKDMQDLLSQKQGDDLAIATAPSSCVTNQNFEHDSFLLPLKEMYADLKNKKAKIEVQMMEISQSLCGMEEEMEKLKSSVEETNKPAESVPKPSLHIGSTIIPQSGTEKEVDQKNKQTLLTSDVEGEEDKQGGNNIKTTTKAIAEDKAAKIERLKSEFTICMPQKTFLWPNIGMSPQPDKVVVQLEDLFLVPTPPSVSSSSASSSTCHLLSPISKFGPLPTSPVKPLPERRPVTVTLTAAVTKPCHPLPLEIETQFEKRTSTAVITTTSTTTRSTETSVINLNEVPCPFNYQRRNQNETTITAIPCLRDDKKEGEMSQRKEDATKEILRDCDQKQKGCSSSASASSLCLSMGAGTWLALATPNSTLDSNPTRG